MTGVRWRELRTGTDDRTIVAVDFGPGRRAASFADLVRELGPGPAVREPVFDQRNGDLLEHAAAEYVAAWLDDLRKQDLHVVGVLGYCAGSSLASAFADICAERQGTRPPVVLFDPQLIDGAALYANFESAVESFAEVTEPTRMAEARALARAAISANRALGDPVALVSAVGAAYERVVHWAAELLGVEDDLTDQMTAHFRSYLSYLVLAAQVVAAPPDTSADTVVLASAGHQLPPGWHASSVFPVARENLLADPRVADAVEQIIGGGTRVDPPPAPIAESARS
ncbi:hypothetical protein ODJ79_19795 [Actinoplanes sp. KI2]|uniref:hypothetical protein n=1 Tax=Actinoplanes sp. KI2 TaxID=2983315 RepID=UPI0021D587BF|nr:hypothetical protein [Actinoplanes sp. KI2]MCU7725973.1 hypothetical protein [Actinoplanes sp. KI2]